MRQQACGWIVPVMLGLQVLSCGGLEPTIREQPPTDHAAIPPMTVERLRDCVKEHGEQLSPGSWAFSPKVKVNREGYLVDVDAGAIPNTAPDLAACTREALSGMNVPSSILQLRPVASAGATNEPTREQRSYLGSPALVVVVVVGLSEVAFEAGAYTILFAVTVEVVDKTLEEIKRLCLDHYVACIATNFYRRLGRGAGDSRCSLCMDVCILDKGKWPSKVGSGRCVD